MEYLHQDSVDQFYRLLRAAWRSYLTQSQEERDVVSTPEMQQVGEYVASLLDEMDRLRKEIDLLKSILETYNDEE